MHNNLNEAQRMAVTHGNGPLLVLAGPGSGKTTVITHRTLWLIREQHISPDKILVLTFTREAAASMKNRFLQLADQNYPVRFGTFHSLFLEILKKSQKFPNYQKIITNAAKRDLLRPVLNKLRPETDYLASESAYERELHARRRKQEDDKLLTEFLDAIGYYKNTGDEKRASGKLDPLWQERFQTLLTGYEAARLRSGAIDYDDMIYECASLLENDEAVRNYWKNRYSHILLDEFQDINPEQYRILKLLKPPGGEVFAVGDDDQSIYAFRGADPSLLKRFKEEYAAESIYLNINYRSPESIVEASLKVINENHDRFVKSLKSGLLEPSKGTTVRIKKFADIRSEDQYLLDRLAEASKEGKCSVLFRTNIELICFAGKLREANFKFTAPTESTDLYKHIVARDITAYLKLACAAGNRDSARASNSPQSSDIGSAGASKPHESVDPSLLECLLRVANKPDRKLTREQILACEGNMSKLSESETGKIFVANLRTLAGRSASLAIPYICKVLGYEKYLKDLGGEDAELLEEWERVLAWMQTEGKRYETIHEWLMQIESEKSKNRNRDKKNSDELQSNIHLMTVHSAKGLEFDYVFMPGCNEGNYPRRRRGSAAEKEKKSKEEQAEEKRYREEERRVFYVGMTRAKKSLELSYLSGTKDHPRLPSGFLNPLL